MITIQSMKGDVAIFDETSQYLEPAVTGMVLQIGRNYMIVTALENSEIILGDGSGVTTISSGQWYVVNKQGMVRKGVPRERQVVRLFFGRLWAMIASENKDLGLSSNVAVGVRG